MEIRIGKVVLAVVLMLSAGVRAQLVTEGLYLCLTADDLALADGAAVTSWIDSESGNVFSGTATYVTGYENGHAAVLFNGSDDILRATTLAAGMPNTSATTLFVVGSLSSIPASSEHYLLSAQNITVDSGNNRLRLAEAGADWRTRAGAGANIDTSGDVADTASHIFSVVSGANSSSAVRLDVDGGEFTSASGTHGVTANCADLNQVNLGGFNNLDGAGSRGFAHCHIAEVLIYDTALTEAQIDQVNTYLSDKYDIALEDETTPVAPVWTENQIDDEVDAGVSYTNILSDFVYDPNVSDQITYVKTDGPEWLNVETNGVATGTPLLGDVGTNTFTVTADDGVFAPVPVVLKIVVANPNAPSGSTLYLQLTAGDLALADGAAVTTWTDSVGTNEFTGTATYEADYTNGHAAVLFNGSSDVLRVTNLAASPDTASVTMFVVGSFVSGLADLGYMVSGQNYEPTWGGNASGDNRLRLAVAATDWRTRIGDGGNIDSAGDVADTDTHVFSVVSGQDASSAVKMLVDGTPVLSGTHGTTANCLDLSAVNLGAYYGRVTQGPNGEGNANCYIAEVRIYDGAMTDLEIETISQELHDKYFVAHEPDPEPVEDLRITGPVSGGTAMEISWTGVAGMLYSVETNSNLVAGNWQPWMSNITGNGSIAVTNTIGLDETFYRVITENE